jgi:hypothetical protein
MLASLHSSQKKKEEELAELKSRLATQTEAQATE